jgi:hypothetical protein
MAKISDAGFIQIDKLGAGNKFNSIARPPLKMVAKTASTIVNGERP